MANMFSSHPFHMYAGISKYSEWCVYLHAKEKKMQDATQIKTHCKHGHAHVMRQTNIINQRTS